MKIAIIYNRDSQNVINLFGVPNREKYGKTSIKRIEDALKAGGHQVVSFEGDKDLIKNLEEFMPRVLKHERPGMAFNLSYGIQGQARYTHVPGILEMIGIPYVGSGPLAHSLALDKVVAKMIFLQHGLPTPQFTLLENSDFELPDIPFPLIVKPRSEAVSFGLKVVHNEEELRLAAQIILDEFEGSVLVEQYIEGGGEINVGVLGNNPPEAFPPVELVFPPDGPAIYTMEDKKGISGRDIVPRCPAQIPPETAKAAQELAIRAFKALGLYDCCRVDIRIDREGNLYILEINSLPSLGARGSFAVGAQAVGLDFTRLANKLVDVASERYFSVPTPEYSGSDKAFMEDPVFAHITNRRDRAEKSLQQWVNFSSRTSDPLGIRLTAQELSRQMTEIGLKPHATYTNDKNSWMWQTGIGYEGGVLFIGQLDVPAQQQYPHSMFKRQPESLYGEGIGSSRGPLVSLMAALKALKAQKLLSKSKVGVLYVADGGADYEYSAEVIHRAAASAGKVLILRAGNPKNAIITQRRGLRKYRLIVEDKPLRLGQNTKREEVLLWLSKRHEQLNALSSRKERVAVTLSELRTEHYPLLLPHRVVAQVLMSYPDEETAVETEKEIRKILGKQGPSWSLEPVSDIPPMTNLGLNRKLYKELSQIAGAWELGISEDSSVWPSPAGFVPTGVPVVCGIGPEATDLYTPNESIVRISLIERALLLAQFLRKQGKAK